MARYAEFEENSEIMDAFYCIILGYGNVKQMVKILKQPQPTISSKLMFLRQNKIVKKEKWSYIPNWVRIYQKMYELLKDNIRVSLNPKTKRIFKENKNLQNKNINPRDYFTDELLRFIVERYARLYFATDEGKFSLNEIVLYFLVGLKNANDRDLKKLNPKLVELKRILIKIPSREDLFFMELTDSIISEETKEVANDMINSLVKS
jgi:DNA-binding transcriptional ArsR family regulator